MGEYIKPSIQSFSEKDLLEVIKVSANSICAFAHCPLPGSYNPDIRPCLYSLWC